MGNLTPHKTGKKVVERGTQIDENLSKVKRRETSGTVQTGGGARFWRFTMRTQLDRGAR